MAFHKLGGANQRGEGARHEQIGGKTFRVATGYERFWPAFTVMAILEIMPNETLELSEHELYFLPPGTPATAPATRVEVEIDGAKRWILARLELAENVGKYDRYYVFWRCVDVTDAHNLVSQLVVLAGSDVSSEKVTHIRQSAETSFFRCWRPPDVDFGITIWREYGSLEWCINGERVKIENFALDRQIMGRELANWTQQEFLKFCSRLYDDTNSSIRGALSWSELSCSEKDAVAFGCENGDWKRLRRLFACAQIIIFKVHGPFPHPLRSDSRWYFDEQWKGHKLKSPAQISAMRWRAVICQIMRPKFCLEEPGYVRNWRQNPPNHVRCRVECSVPTAHEFLEAQLELREFLRPHLPSGEIEKLFHPQTNQL